MAGYCWWISMDYISCQQWAEINNSKSAGRWDALHYLRFFVTKHEVFLRAKVSTRTSHWYILWLSFYGCFTLHSEMFMHPCGCNILSTKRIRGCWRQNIKTRSKRSHLLVKVYSSLRKDIVHINCGPATPSFSSPFLPMSLEGPPQRQQTEMEHPNNTLFGL